MDLGSEDFCSVEDDKALNFLLNGTEHKIRASVFHSGPPRPIPAETRALIQQRLAAGKEMFLVLAKLQRDGMSHLL